MSRFYTSHVDFMTLYDIISNNIKGMNKQNIKFIKKLRSENDFSQAFVAEKLGISRSSYIAVEQGKRDLSLDEAVDFSKLFKITVSDLLSNNKKKEQKYEQMLFTFLRTLDENEKVPKTKLVKMLYLADFANFYNQHESMSGLEYRKIEYGPVPDYYFRLIQELSDDGKIDIDPTKSGALLISETRVGERVDDGLLNLEEKKLIKKIAKKWDDKNTKEIVAFTHSQIPYTFVDKGEIIPYELITQEDPQHVY